MFNLQEVGHQLRGIRYQELKISGTINTCCFLVLFVHFSATETDIEMGQQKEAETRSKATHQTQVIVVNPDNVIND